MTEVMKVSEEARKLVDDVINHRAYFTPYPWKWETSKSKLLAYIAKLEQGGV